MGERRLRPPIGRRCGLGSRYGGALDEGIHADVGLVPRKIGQGRIALGEPGAVHVSRLGQRRLAGRHEGLGRVRDPDGGQVAIVADDVADRGGDHWLARGQIFRGLCRADEAGGVVDGERHQGDVPFRQPRGQVGVVGAARVMNVGTPRQFVRRNLHDRPDHDDRPVRPCVGHGGDQLQIHPLIEDAIEPQDGPARGADRHLAGLREMGAVDTGREGIDVGVQMLLRFIQAVSAGEDHIRRGDQLLLQGTQGRRGEAEIRQLVHAVIDDGRGLDVPRDRQHHGRVVPEYRTDDVSLADQGVQ